MEEDLSPEEMRHWMVETNRSVHSPGCNSDNFMELSVRYRNERELFDWRFKR